MSIITGYVLLDTLLIFVVLTVWLFHWIVRKYSLWSRLGIYGPTPKFPFGNLYDVMTKEKTSLEFWTGAYNRLKRKKKKFGGYYSFIAPFLVLTDPDLYKAILTKDFEHFYDRGTYVDEKGDPLTAHLVNLRGEKWKKLRGKLTPTFSSGKLKSMFQILVDVSAELDKCLKSNIKGQDDIDIKHILGRFTTDIIGNCAFGIECSTLDNPDVPFYIYSKEIFERKFWKNIKVTFARMFPKIYQFFGIKVIDKKHSDFYMGIVKDVIEMRKKNDVVRNDFMQILIGLMNTPGEDSVTFNEIAAQAFVFFLAGYETSATAMTFALYELAANEDIQETLREEVDDVKRKFGKLSYDALLEMPFLDKVISETLRKYPPFPFTIRECTLEYTIPDTEIHLPKGTHVLIPIFPIQRDPEYYPEPEVFDPERFSDENKKHRHQYTYIPFGEGPRICIGMRFALLVAKVGVFQLISKYKFTVSPKTQLPMKFDSENLSLTAKGKIWLKAEEITDL